MDFSYQDQKKRVERKVVVEKMRCLDNFLSYQESLLRDLRRQRHEESSKLLRLDCEVVDAADWNRLYGDMD